MSSDTMSIIKESELEILRTGLAITSKEVIRANEIHGDLLKEINSQQVYIDELAKIIKYLLGEAGEIPEQKASMIDIVIKDYESRLNQKEEE